jgi:4'-phosphopantetheinyl transferase
VRPSDIHFSYGPHGKPALASPLSNIRFNISHSNHLAVFAFTGGCEVGVDVELIRPDIDSELLSQRFLPHSQASTVQDAPPDQQAAVFLHHWTRIEAITKMFGYGVTGYEPSEDMSQASVPRTVHVLSFGTQAIISLATSKPIQVICASKLK